MSNCGVGRIGSADATEDDLPGVGAIDWNSECDGDHAEMRFTPSASGWYRIGARLQTTDERRDFGWEAVDVKIVETDESRWVIESQWKVSPRL
ncbi:hypothetical protein BG842_01305 [Haladaptatus sp. W1]|uniref:hypothetical protein n=1 Tax=Haladaptatus sp. W1 TaxID=1897478 RepID=UPI000849DD6B|nr:hypothetical protein [Haladaptatus sp. W1]ODR82378.1 hypothetical protein BG842_01305 [Haladaptatus sp. W1]